MARIPRMVIKDEPAVYHIMSRTALDGFVIGDVEKEYLLKLIKRLSQIYFTEILGFCLMGNHFHLVTKMLPGKDFSDDEICRRFKLYRGEDSEAEFHGGQTALLRERWESLSEFVKEIKQTFTRYYNKRHHRRGFFWGGRFKSVIVEKGDSLVNCLAYVDLNPVRAAMVERPEDYRWSSLGYHIQTGNKGKLLSLDFGLTQFSNMRAGQRLSFYRRFVYEAGSLPCASGKSLDSELVEKEEARNFELSKVDVFRYRSRYFTDSGVIGTKEFVTDCWFKFQDNFNCRREKKPRIIEGLDGVYSLKRLVESG